MVNNFYDSYADSHEFTAINPQFEIRSLIQEQAKHRDEFYEMLLKKANDSKPY